ncbi:cyclic nucleotide-binding domain-containing protein [Paraburkholderia sp. Tr-20389]|uniref:ATP-binding protein n=1 Tax=Paraburkholderia sp. Tr-20389 TaxID=2703903 RepID=UPI00197F3535|nr:ATP-binding protein [Paraburkholderia sp. Tr-20389]MBN3756337.1 cyclic nucleotide-binding domain-containing protein [Paraburkholderia sp. Tr-20389]
MSDLSTLFEMPLFADLPEAQQAWLRANLTEHRLKKGDILMREGQRVTHQFILLDGELITEKTIGGRQVFDDRRPAPVSIAEASLLAAMPLPLTFIAATDCYLAALPERVVRALLNQCGSFSQHIFRSMYARISAYDTFILNGEKLAALGRLSAGLAHELNNPAAAVARAADGMRESLGHLRQATPALVLSAMPAELVGKLVDWANRAAPAVDATPQAALRQSEAENRLADWLAAQGIEKPWLIAPQLSTAGFSPADLEAVAASATAEQFGALIRWLAAALDLRSLANQAWLGAGRISEIVKAMKDYSYMDQAPLQEVDIHNGIEDTLTIMRHKLKQGVTVKRDYDRTLPHVPVYGSELNQVWTNLIDNAVDAMDGSGELTIRSRRDGNFAMIEIVDTGTGIPPHVLPRLFEPFFTTKPPGKGSGLGLHIAYRTVVQRHNGMISVASHAGETIFKVCLPLSAQPVIDA